MLDACPTRPGKPCCQSVPAATLGQPLVLSRVSPGGALLLTWRASGVGAGSRDAHKFLQVLGVGGKLQQSLVAHYGAATEARLRADPYAALFPIASMSFRCGPTESRV